MNNSKSTYTKTGACVCKHIFVMRVQVCTYEHVLELGSTQILETVRYYIKYHGINNYHSILINAFMYPVKHSNNFS